MSTRYEWAHADYLTPRYIEHGHFPDGEAPDMADYEPGTKVEDIDGVIVDRALVLSYDEAFVIEGGPDALRNLAHRILAALPAPQAAEPADLLDLL